MDIIVNVFVTLLTFLYSVLNQDMVLAIIVFTIITRLLLYPLTAQSLRSSRAMQQLQPELKALQEKYKNDREKLAQEQMALYRQYGINPLGGCLPLLIQMPIFFALYGAIQFALAASPTHLLDLSGRLLVPGLDGVIPLNATWLGMNLAQPPNISASPIGFVLIGLIVVTTWLQMKLSMPPQPKPAPGEQPSAAQATSQSMTTVMPLMYVFFGLSFSIGVSIYIIATNVAMIAQGFITGQAKVSYLTGKADPNPTPVVEARVSKASAKTPTRSLNRPASSENGKSKTTSKSPTNRSK
ncbi:MAG: YidC/Oxa1 family membrane protein insertase [Anaerolinea sp.]|nr:YidC/Oxa1 family membrane protein insertase [Anaerolinea sp.]